jgi:hypothetical protein
MQYVLTHLEKLLFGLGRTDAPPGDMQWYAALLEEKAIILQAFAAVLTSPPEQTAQYRQHHRKRLQDMKMLAANFPEMYVMPVCNTLDDLLLGLDLPREASSAPAAVLTKAHINMSVQELAMLCRTLWELRIVSADFKADMIRLVTRNFTTKGAGRKEPISEQHFRRRMGTASVQSCDTLRRLLKSVLSRVDELKIEAIQNEKNNRSARLAIE